MIPSVGSVSYTHLDVYKRQPHMLQLFIEAGITLQEKLPHTDQNLRHIRMDQLTIIRIQDIVSASLLVKSKGQRPILILIPKGKLHLIADVYKRQDNM